MAFLLHSTDEANPLSILKDLYLVSAVVLWSYVYYIEGTSLPRIIIGLLLYLGPIIFYWTPFMQDRLSFRNLSQSRNVKYLWLLYLIAALIPFLGTLVVYSRILLYYRDESVEDTLGLSKKKKENESNPSYLGKENGDIEDSESQSTSEEKESENESQKEKSFSGPTVKEYKRVCNECGEEWHSLVSREKKLKRRNGIESLQECLSGLTCNYDAAAQERKNRQDTESELENLKKCPNCNSRNYDEEVIEYEK